MIESDQAPRPEASTVSEPMTCTRARVDADHFYCDRCDLLVGLAGFHVVEVAEQETRRGVVLRVAVESPPREGGCPVCGVIASSHGRRLVRLVDVPGFGRPVELAWRKRTWRCADPACAGRVFTEQHDDLARPRALLTVRACWWAIGQLRREHASMQGLARQLGTTWRTVWTSIKPLLEALAGDESRFDGVTSLGVDEHVVRHEALLFGWR
jgi:transposase